LEDTILSESAAKLLSLCGIQDGKTNTVKLPTTAVELSATAADASGNKATGMTVLSITD